MKMYQLLFFTLVYFMGFSYAVAHPVCRPITEDQPYFSKLKVLDKLAYWALSKEVPVTTQNDIQNFHEHILTTDGHQPSANIKIIISGGTRPSAMLTRENHRAYAHLRGMDYRFVYPLEFEDELKDKQKYWLKVFALKNLLECGNIPYNSWVVWLDDDIVIDDYHNSVGMLDKYIDTFGHEGEILLVEDIDYAKINTGILLVKKTENTRSFMHMWSLYSNDPIKGYKSQHHTLHEQQALKEFLKNNQFIDVNEAIGLIKVVKSRYTKLNMNLNTFKREKYFNNRYGHREDKLEEVGNEGGQYFQPGDTFIHHGTKNFRTRLIMGSLKKSMKNYEKSQPHNESPGFWFALAQWLYPYP